MGSCFAAPGWEHQRLAIRDLLERIHMRDGDARRIYNAFHRADLDKGGTLSFPGLLELVNLEEEKAAFARRVFFAMDESGDSSLDFPEFMLGLWNMCSLDTEGLIQFVFYLYDLDSSSEGLDMREMKRVVLDVLGTDNAARLMDSLERTNPSKVFSGQCRAGPRG